MTLDAANGGEARRASELGPSRPPTPAWCLRVLPPRLRTRLTGTRDRQRLVANTGWLLGDRVVRLVVGLAITALVTRHLGPEQFGLLSYAVAVVTLFGAVASLGLDSVVVRDLVRKPQDAPEILGTAIAMRCAGGAAVFCLALALVGALRPGHSAPAQLVAIIAAGSIVQSLEVVDLWFQSQVRSKYAVYARSAAFLLLAAVRVALVAGGAPLVAFALASLAEVTIASAGLAIAYRVTGGRIARWRLSRRRARELLATGWPLAFSGLAVGVYMKVDMVMLGALSGDAAVGIYSAATRVSELWYFIPLAITTSIAPTITAAKTVDEARYYAQLDRLFHGLALLALLIAVPMTVLSGPLVGALYGPRYADAGPVLALHVWSALFVFLGLAQSCWTVNEGLVRLELARTVAGAASNVALNLVLIPPYGAVGAAAATVISYALSAVALNALHPKTRVIFRLQVDAVLCRRIGRWVA